MQCVCGKELTSTSATPWMSCTTDSTGKVISGICQHGINFPSIEIISAKNPFATYKDYVDHLMKTTPKENQI